MGLKINKPNNFGSLEDKVEEQRELQDDTTMLLHSIIKELKIMNMHLMILTDTHITKKEVE